jgi:hypothetical protein
LIVKKISGTKEWAVANVNCCDGCSHNCRYCYARAMQCDRLKRIKLEDWPNEKIRTHDVDRPRKLYPGTVMFPTTHDITEKTMKECCIVLWKLLTIGNKVLIVSKPHLPVIKFLCRELYLDREQLMFRFTIGARDNKILKFWEPGAPTFEERRDALRIAFNKGFSTSVSVEPMLNSSDVVDMFYYLEPNISDTYWIGKMNKIAQRVKYNPKDADERWMVNHVIEGQTDDCIRCIYEWLKDEPKVRWKESIKSVVGLPLATEAGTDL